jgi:ectoine hydroxylase-related dioxygenase (phytanoyl-CoA dioxygenase family)
MKTLKRYSLGKDGLPTAAAIKAYERDGVVCIENAFDPEWVSHGRRAVAAAISTAAKSALREDHVVNEGKGLFFFDTFLWRRLPSFRKFTFESPAAHLAKKVMRSKSFCITSTWRL